MRLGQITIGVLGMLRANENQISTGIVMRLRSLDMHHNCRNKVYPGTGGKINRFPVPDDKVSWKEDYPEYDPPTYTSSNVSGKPWADPEIGADGFHPENEWNNNCGKINRTCPSHKYEIDEHGFPINPVGRTGLKGRGNLGRWGPNHAGDALITRWRRIKGKILINSKGKPILEFLAVKRKDCGQWAIPGGFAHPGEDIYVTIKREFVEETLKGLNFCDPFLYEPVLNEMDEFFDNCGETVYNGYIDDVRNTDQAWITSLVVNYHDETGEVFRGVKFNAGDDAVATSWMEINQYLDLYANHKHFVRDVAFKHNSAYF